MSENTRGQWVFERSSGYAGWRCKVCKTWVYNGTEKNCKCDAEGAGLTQMTEDEFQRDVHEYRTRDREQAIRDAAKYQEKGVDCVAVSFGDGNYALMLYKAAEFVAGAVGLSIIGSRKEAGDERKTSDRL